MSACQNAAKACTRYSTGILTQATSCLSTGPGGVLPGGCGGRILQSCSLCRRQAYAVPSHSPSSWELYHVFGKNTKVLASARQPLGYCGSTSSVATRRAKTPERSIYAGLTRSTENLQPVMKCELTGTRRVPAPQIQARRAQSAVAPSPSRSQHAQESQDGVVSLRSDPSGIPASSSAADETT